MEPFEYSGGALCLDFVNTLGDRPLARKDRLADYGDLLRWADEAGLAGGRSLRPRAASDPAGARRAFRAAIRLREATYRLFSARAAGREPAHSDLATLNAALGPALARLRLEAGADGLRWTFAFDPERLDSLVGPVVRSAADLLASPDAARVRECASESCSWLFLDRSRTLRRRWCDMKICGNRAKARRHYRRTKKEAGRRASG